MQRLVVAEVAGVTCSQGPPHFQLHRCRTDPADDARADVVSVHHVVVHGFFTDCKTALF